MNIRTLKTLWKANIPPMVWLCLPLLIGAIIRGLDGRAPEWAPIALFLVTITLLMAILEFANVYADRDEDRLYFPNNPIVTGELDAGKARKVLILENIAAGVFLIALLSITLNYSLIIVMIGSWFVNLAYSLPPLRLKETVADPFNHAFLYALPTMAAWLVVEPSFTAGSGFIIAFASLLFLFSFGYGITVKFRKTFHALNSGLIRVEEGGSVYDVRTVGLGLKVKTAMALEATTILAAFALVPIFWHLGIFDATLSVALLAVALPTAVFAIAMRVKDPVKNAPKCLVLIIMAAVDIGMVLFGVAVTNYIHWGFAVLACIVYLLVFIPLFRNIEPYGRMSVTAPWREI